MSRVTRNVCGASAFLLAFSIGALAATLNHFNPSSTGVNMTVSVQASINPTIDGINLAHGDEIGVFNSTGLCVGARAWKGTTTGIPVSGDDTYAPGIQGMLNGEKFTLRVWDSSLNIEMAAQVTYDTSATAKANPTYADSTYMQDRVSILTSLSGISAPLLAVPSNAAMGQPIAPTLSWGSVGNAASYTLQVSTATDFSSFAYSSAGLAATAQALSGLSNLTGYYWRTRTLNTTGGTSDWSSVWSFTTVLGAPLLTSPACGAGNTPVSLSLTWGSSAGAISYEVEVSSSNLFGTTVFDQSGALPTGMTVSGLVNATTYYWRANASNADGATWSNVWSFTTIVAAPAAPNIALPADGAANVPVSLSLAWGSSAGATSYEVEISLSSAFDATVFDQSGAVLTNATAAGLLNSTTYYWRANASNVGGTNWSNARSFTTIAATPDAPVLSAPSNNVQNQPLSLSLSWGTTALATSYEVQVSLSSAFGTTLLDQSGASLTGAALSGLTNSTTYYWRANSSNIGGTNWSNAWSFTTIIAAPSVPILSLPSDGSEGQLLSLSLSWQSAASAATYSVQISTSADFGATVFGNTTLISANVAVSGLALYTTYYWHVNAANVGGTGGWSETWRFTTEKQITLHITKNWNLVSLNIHPSDSTFSGILGSPDSFILAKDAQGTVYCPKMGIRNLSTFQTGQGYQIYSTLADSFIARGAAINTENEPVALSKNWNILGYLPESDQPIQTELFGIASSITLAKDNEGRIYWPAYNIDNIVTMQVGKGYYIYMKEDVTLTYGASFYKQVANGKSMLQLPNPRHFGKHETTGNSASLLAQQVVMNGNPVGDSSEIGAYDSRGNLVGSGTVIHGIAAFAVWGDNPLTKQKDGCSEGEAVAFKLWSKGQEYPLEFQTAGGAGTHYAENGIFMGTLSVASGSLIKQFDLSKAYPNPFRGSVHIAFDVPEIKEATQSDVVINVYDMKGALVQQLARGKYPAGHYSVTWNDATSQSRAIGATMYIVRMKANNFDKRLKLIRVQ